MSKWIDKRKLSVMYTGFSTEETKIAMAKAVKKELDDVFKPGTIVHITIEVSKE